MLNLLPCPFCGEPKISLNPPTKDWPKGSINCPACLAMIPGEVRGDGWEDELIAQWNSRDAQHPGTRAAVIEECAELADAFADENLRMAHDTLMLDPCLTGKGFSPENLEASRKKAIEGCVHSSMHLAAKNIAESLRKLDGAVEQ